MRAISRLASFSRVLFRSGLFSRRLFGRGLFRGGLFRGGLFRHRFLCRRLLGRRPLHGLLLGFGRRSDWALGGGDGLFSRLLVLFGLFVLCLLVLFFVSHSSLDSRSLLVRCGR